MVSNNLWLYDIAGDNDIPVVSTALPQTSSLCIQDCSQCCIALDCGLKQMDERTHLSHELGHCMTGSFYNRNTPLDVRQKCENKADKWAVETCIKPDDIDGAIADGCTEWWQLAEHLGVTEDFAKKAVCYYTYGNLETRLYF